MRYNAKEAVFLLSENFGGILGTFPQNSPHRHFTVQITISDNELTTYVNGEKLRSKSSIIASNTTHNIDVLPSQSMLILNINPLSELGFWCKSQLSGKGLVSGDIGFMNMLWQTVNAFSKKEQTAEQLEKNMLDYLSFHFPKEIARKSILDERVLKSLRLLRSQPITSAKEMAHHLALSESRFLHLFKKEAGLTYRRMSLWFRLEKSFRCFHQFTNLTSLSHHCGFFDSAHYSRTFKETFGVKPSELLKNSRFIQA